MSTKDQLPSKRAFLTTLFKTLSAPNPGSETASNPLKSLSPQNRSIILTLHVLFPNELLPALDLLDRSLVFRLRLPPPATQTSPPPPPNSPLSPAKDKDPGLYYVRSAQQPASTHSSRSHGHGYRHNSDTNASRFRIGASTTEASDREHEAMMLMANSTHYQVRPRAWNCSCPAFAFAAFPATAGATTTTTGGGDGDGGGTTAALPVSLSHLCVPRDADADVDGSVHGGDRTGDERDTPVVTGHGREVGGLSRGEDVPVCKHLLACVLVDQCQLFEGFVVEREIEADEMIGWAAGWGG